MAETDFFLVMPMIIVLGIGQYYVGRSQNDVNKAVYDYLVHAHDRIDQLQEENKNLQNKVDLLETSVYNENVR